MLKLNTSVLEEADFVDGICKLVSDALAKKDLDITNSQNVSEYLKFFYVPGLEKFRLKSCFIRN